MIIFYFIYSSRTYFLFYLFLMNTISDTVCIIFVHFYIAVCNVRKSLINRIIYRIIVCSLLFNLLLTTTRIQSTNWIRKNLLSCKHISMTVFKSECLISRNKERNRGLHHFFFVAKKGNLSRQRLIGVI